MLISFSSNKFQRDLSGGTGRGRGGGNTPRNSLVLYRCIESDYSSHALEVLILFFNLTESQESEEIS